MTFPLPARATIVATVLVMMTLTAAPAHARLDVTVRPGDTLSGIAAAHGLRTSALADVNGIGDPDRIVVGMVLVIPGAAESSYEVRSGDTLSTIAARLGVSLAALAEANGINDVHLIRVGQRLRVAGGSSTAAAPSADSGAGAQDEVVGGQAVSRDEVRRLVTSTAERYGWRARVPLGLAMQESGWNNTVVSPAGAMGIMQVLPSTGEWVARTRVGRALDLRDPADNVEAGMAYLDYLYSRFDGDIELVLAAYFEGPARVSANGPSESGLRYADNVLALADRHG